jgi:hypothetical protein
MGYTERRRVLPTNLFVTPSSFGQFTVIQTEPVQFALLPPWLPDSSEHPG